jgi:hypothetical protein
MSPEAIDALVAAGVSAEQLAAAVKGDMEAAAEAKAARRAAGGWLGLRMAVFERDGYRCTYCGSEGDEFALHCDHVIPRCDGGSDNINNLTTACRHCNLSKGGRAAPKVRT